MARTFHRRERPRPISELNVTPLIDLAFALLIIFMITAPLLEQTIDVALPVESPRTQADSPDRVQRVVLNANGELFWGDEAISLEELDFRLELLAVEAEPPVVSVRADAGLPYQRIIDVIDLVKQHELTRLSLETRAR